MLDSDTLAPYDLIHGNRFFLAHLNGRTAIVNFTHTTEPISSQYLHGKVLDEYGWWHTGLVFDCANLPELTAHTPDHQPIPTPEPAPFPVTIAFDNWHRMHLRIPTGDARRLKVWSNENWTEFHGMGDGRTSSPEPGTWEHRALAYQHMIGCHVTDRHPFIEGEDHADGYDGSTMVSTSGITAGRWPHGGFYISG